MSQGFVSGPAPSDRTAGVCLRNARERLSAVEIGILMASGVLAALAVAMIHMNLRIPGHAILKPLLPITIGLALVPRRASGCVIGLSAAATAAILIGGRWGEIHASTAASLTLLGPLLDLAARGTHTKSGLLARFAMAGLVTNLAALGVKLVAAPLGWESGGGRGFAALWPFTILTFAACGLLAGCVAVLVGLAAARRDNSDRGP